MKENFMKYSRLISSLMIGIGCLAIGYQIGHREHTPIIPEPKILKFEHVDLPTVFSQPWIHCSQHHNERTGEPDRWSIYYFEDEGMGYELTLPGPSIYGDNGHASRFIMVTGTGTCDDFKRLFSIIQPAKP